MNKFSLLSIFVFLISCESKPKVIVADLPAGKPASETMSPPASGTDGSGGGADVHAVTADSILYVERYTYIKVSEKGEKYWIAVPRQEIALGKQYIFRGGLKKTDFPSQEFNRTFDVIYLVSKIMDASEHPGGELSSKPTSTATGEPVKMTAAKAKDAVALSDILKNKSKYEGKIIKVQGKCVKANFNIMGKNWFHIQDGTKHDGKVSDLTITSLDVIQLNQETVFEGKIFINKDFGAGYKYDIIMEEAKMLK